MMRRLAFGLVTAMVGCGLSFDFEDLRPGSSRDGGLDVIGRPDAPVTPPFEGGVDAPPDTGPPPADVDAAVPCVGEAAKLETGHCYFRLVTAQTFESARNACIGLGAHLLTVSNAAEHAIARDIAKNNTSWIGLRAAPAFDSDAAAYAWITNEAVTATFWQSGQPDGNENGCVVFNAAENAWSDRTCEANNQAICERDP